jgi:DNA invertase Pin-like site-specific DNA recombinase
MRLVGYMRVSTQGQAESGLGLDAQRERIAAYAALYGHEIVEWCVDAGASGKSLDRPALASALAALDGGQADGVCVAKLDRLTRSVRDLGDLLEGPLRRSALVSVGEQIDTSTAAGRMVLNILASVAQWEREAIGERTSAALQAKRARGERVGAVRYGFELAEDGRTEVPCDAEQAIIAEARRLRAAGLSLREVARELEEEGHRGRSGARIGKSQVARMVA